MGEVVVGTCKVVAAVVDKDVVVVVVVVVVVAELLAAVFGVLWKAMAVEVSWQVLEEVS